MTKEFDLIARHFSRPLSHTLLGIGDDAALISPTAGNELAVSTDTLVSGVHFFNDADPEKLGHKALAVNLSDMAAMGADARWATLAIALPADDDAWLTQFSRGFFRLAREYALDLIGGDTTRGPLCITVQIIGHLPAGTALRRDGALPGHDIWVSGRLGEAALGVAHLQNKIRLDTASAAVCLRRLHTPQPRIALGRALCGTASAAIDISDGLLADLGHIASRSNVAAEIMFELVPGPADCAGIDPNSVRDAVFAGGDDYELCFCADPAHRVSIEALAQRMQLPLTRIGRVTSGSGVRVVAADGHPLEFMRRGFDHFEPVPSSSPAPDSR